MATVYLATDLRLERRVAIKTILKEYLENAEALDAIARFKREYPDELFCDPDTAATVTRRWKEYFPKGGVEMGDSDAGHLDKL